MLFSKFIPEHIIANLYTRGSLQPVEGGLSFSIKNRLMNAELTGIESVLINGEAVPFDNIQIYNGKPAAISPAAISATNTVAFPLRKALEVFVKGAYEQHQEVQFDIRFKTKPFGILRLKFKDQLQQSKKADSSMIIPRSEEDDYTNSIIEQRRGFAESFSGASFHHLMQNSFAAATVKGNCENFFWRCPGTHRSGWTNPHSRGMGKGSVSGAAGHNRGYPCRFL